MQAGGWPNRYLRPGPGPVRDGDRQAHLRRGAARVAVLERDSSTASAPSRGGVFARLRQSAGSIYASLPGRLDPRVTPPAPLPSDAFVPSPAGESSIRSANGSAGAKTPVPTTMESAQAPETETPVSAS